MNRAMSYFQIQNTLTAAYIPFARQHSSHYAFSQEMTSATRQNILHVAEKVQG